MKVILAKSAGFCYGVRRAVELAEARAKEGPVYMLGHITHNDHVVARLEALGARTVFTPEEVPDGAAVLIRAHGEPERTYAVLREKRCQILDATCPNVARIHQIVAKAEEQGRTPVIIGDPEHPGIVGISGGTRHGVVARNWEELEKKLQKNPELYHMPLTFVSQTTAIRTIWEKCMENAKKVCTNLKVFDTICRATIERQSEAKQLAQSADAMVVVGGLHSANTTALAALCGSYCPTVQVETADQLERHREALRGARFIGITAGASTPACIIKEVQNSMSVLENNTEEMNFGELLDQYSKSIHNGEKVTAVVTGIKPTEISVDAGTKHACYVPLD